MTIEIDPETEQILQEAIANGFFRTRDEAIVKGVHAWFERFGKTKAVGQKPKLSLVDVLRSAPLGDDDLVIERQDDPMKEIGLRTDFSLIRTFSPCTSALRKIINRSAIGLKAFRPVTPT